MSAGTGTMRAVVLKGNFEVCASNLPADSILALALT
jgi:hypothetical protein